MFARLFSDRVGTPQPPEAPPTPEPPPRDTDVVIPPFGHRCGNLTRFGSMWINLDDVSVIEFNPADGCGAEFQTKGASDNLWHMDDQDAAALRIYLDASTSTHPP